MAQTFEVDQIEQLFRPRLRVDTRYISDAAFKDTSGLFNQLDAGLVMTFPLRTRISAEVKPDLSSLKLRDILKNSIRIKASQLLGSVRAGYRQPYLGFDSLKQKQLMHFTGSLMGVNLTRRYNVLFYSISAGIAEESSTLSSTGPRISGLIGQLHIKGLRRNYFYGLGLAYSDGLILPAPFIGGSEPLGRRFIFNYILPLQINLQYKDEDKRTSILVGISADGYRNGIRFKDKRVNMNYTSVVSFCTLKYRFSKTFLVRLEAGYILWQSIQYSQSEQYVHRYNIRQGPYVQAGFNVLMGKSAWEKIFEGFRN